MRKLVVLFSNLTLFILALSMIFPFIVMVYLSFVPTSQIFSHSYGLNLSLDNYRNVFNDIPVLTYFLNSLIVALLSTIANNTNQTEKKSTNNINNNQNTKNGLAALRNALDSNSSGIDIVKAVYQIAQS